MGDSVLQNQQGKYVRGRENPFFDGLRRGNTSMINRASIRDFWGRKISRSASASASAIGHTGDVPKNMSYSSSKASSGNDHLGSSPIPDVHSELSMDNRITDVTGPRGDDRYDKSYSAGVSLPLSAASFYYGYSLQSDVVEYCQSLERLNLYLKASKDAVNAGIPGRFLRAVLGPVSDTVSFISTIMYSFYLNETDKSSHFCNVPVINIKRADLNSHAELKWLLNSCNIDQPSLLFIDEVDLSYYNIFGSLKVVLLNADKMPEKQEALKESLVDIFHCQKGGFAQPSDDTIVDEQDCSSCALIAKKFMLTSPEILLGKGFSRLLLAGILLDTGNLTSPRCTSVDRYMSTLLINGAGRFGCNGLYQILRNQMHDVSHLSVRQILQKDFRKWTRTGEPDSGGSRLVASDVGMSVVGTSIPQLLSHDETAAQEIVLFQQLEKLRLLIIVSGYYDRHKNFKEILFSAESEDLMKDLLHFLDTHASHLKLHLSYQPGVSDEMRAFTIGNVASRTIVEQLLQDFCTC